MLFSSEYKITMGPSFCWISKCMLKKEQLTSLFLMTTVGGCLYTKEMPPGHVAFPYIVSLLLEMSFYIPSCIHTLIWKMVDEK